MKLKTYQAYSMAQALAAVKSDLGPGAVILNTRSFRRGGILGVGRRTVIELTATAEDEPAPLEPRALVPGAAAARRAYAAPEAMKSSGHPLAALGAHDGPSDLDRLKTRRLAQAMLEQHERRTSGRAAENNADAAAQAIASQPIASQIQAQPGSPITHPAPAPLAIHVAPPAAPATAIAPQSRVAQRFILTAHDRAESAVPLAVPAHSVAPAAANAAGPAADLYSPTPSDPSFDRAPAPDEGALADPVMRDELAAIKRMVGEVLDRQAVHQRSLSAAGGGARGGAPAPAMPERLFDMYLALVAQDLSSELADRIVNDVRDELSGPELEDESCVRAAVLRGLADYVPIAERPVPLRSPDGRPLTIALVGPTGVGKTTTLAKLAASFTLRHQRRVGLVTADTYRIAAVEQLRTYANIIGVPLEVVCAPEEMARALEALRQCDVILIDTAGRSQNDPDRIEELDRFVRAADPHEVHLVLSSTASEKVLVREAEAFSAVGVDKVVLTKLDEAVSFGVLINAVRQIGKSLSFFTTGQEVPEDLEVGRAERLAELLLGGALDLRVEDAMADATADAKADAKAGRAEPAGAIG